MSALQDCKHCGFKWPKLDNAGRCAMCIARSGQPTERDERMRAEGATTERARIVAIARNEADGYAATLREMDPCTWADGPCPACVRAKLRAEAARDALVELVGRIDP